MKEDPTNTADVRQKCMSDVRLWLTHVGQSQNSSIADTQMPAGHVAEPVCVPFHATALKRWFHLELIRANEMGRWLKGLVPKSGNLRLTTRGHTVGGENLP